MRSIHYRAASCTFALLAALGSAALNSTAARAAILDLYHLGEADAGAVAGNTGENPTMDSGPGAHNLSPDGTPTYSSNVGAPGSTLSMAFNGTTDDYQLNNVVTTLTSNVGIDAWLFPTSISGPPRAIVYNGTSSSSGFGLYQNGGTGSSATIIGLLGGVSLGPSVNIPLNQWTEVTQLLQGGKDMLFVNHVLTASMTIAPHAPSGTFYIAGHGGGEFFQGGVDEVTVFTTPEPSALAMFGLAAVGLVTAVRRSRGMNKRQ